MRTYRCKKQQDTFSHLYLHHHALRNDQCFSDRIFQKHPEWLPSGSGSGHPDPYFSSGIIGKPLKLSVVEKESIIYSNSGNLVIPLVTVVLGEKWVIYASAFLSVQMILMWTHGQSLMEAKAGINWKKILCNINLIAIILGIVLFFTQIRLPVILGNTMSQISATLGPVCMIMLGMTMTEVKWKDIFSHSRIYLITILKMVVTPLLILLFLKYLPLASMVKDGKTILLISLMAVITPSATTIVQLAQLYDQDPVYASTINVMTTLVSIITMPLMVMLYLA